MTGTADQQDSVECSELVIPGPAQALAGLLDVDTSMAQQGDQVPPLWHWVYFLPRPRQSELGDDGHPVTGIPAPPQPGVRRMFAGGRVDTIAPLRTGVEARRIITIAKTVHKEGRSGPLTFVTTRIAIEQDERPVVVEEQDIVYRPPAAIAPAPAAERTQLSMHPAGAALTFSVDPTVLFRFSALTYNAHRIHYDMDYAHSEGYPDLVVHGPLQAILMAELLRRSGQSLVGTRFAYRLLAPTFGAQQLSVYREHPDSGAELEVRDCRGIRTATAVVSDINGGTEMD